MTPRGNYGYAQRAMTAPITPTPREDEPPLTVTEPIGAPAAAEAPATPGADPFTGVLTPDDVAKATTRALAALGTIPLDDIVAVAAEAERIRKAAHAHWDRHTRVRNLAISIALERYEVASAECRRAERELRRRRDRGEFETHRDYQRAVDAARNTKRRALAPVTKREVDPETAAAAVVEVARKAPRPADLWQPMGITRDRLAKMRPEEPGDLSKAPKWLTDRGPWRCVDVAVEETRWIRAWDDAMQQIRRDVRDPALEALHAPRSQGGPAMAYRSAAALVNMSHVQLMKLHRRSAGQGTAGRP